jgi:hypothetical protein
MKTIIKMCLSGSRMVVMYSGSALSVRELSRWLDCRAYARCDRKRCDGDILMQRRNARRSTMQFPDIFVQRWHNSNPDVRKRAVERLRDIQLLAQIAEKDEDPGVSQLAKIRLARIQVKETVA